MYPNPSVSYSNTVRPGDHFNASVTYTGSNHFSLAHQRRELHGDLAAQQLRSSRTECAGPGQMVRAGVGFPSMSRAVVVRLPVQMTDR